jgi:hypothetical protein
MSSDIQSFACLECRKRKVKCNRQDPCNNCMRFSKECLFVAPVRGKRGKAKKLKENTHSKLRRYEELLRSHGVELAHNLDTSEEETISEIEPSDGDGQLLELDEEMPKLVTSDKSSRYFDK